MRWTNADDLRTKKRDRSIILTYNVIDAGMGFCNLNYCGVAIEPVQFNSINALALLLTLS